MKLYLDEDSSSPVLLKLLRQAGHDAEMATECQMRSRPDPVHLARAIRNSRVLLTSNHDDFLVLHELVRVAQGHHPGILVVRRDNDPRRDLTPRGIVHAIARLVAAEYSTGDAFVILNHWR